MNQSRLILINVAATFGVTWHKMGLDIGIVPVGIVTANFRLDLDF